MAIINELGVLIGVKRYSFKNDDGEMVTGCKVVMARPSRPEESSTGYVVYDLGHFGQEGFDKYSRLAKEAEGLSFEMVNVECELLITGTKPKLIPISIKPA